MRINSLIFSFKAILFFKSLPNLKKNLSKKIFRSSSQNFIS